MGTRKLCGGLLLIGSGIAVTIFAGCAAASEDGSGEASETDEAAQSSGGTVSHLYRGVWEMKEDPTFALTNHIQYLVLGPHRYFLKHWKCVGADFDLDQGHRFRRNDGDPLLVDTQVAHPCATETSKGQWEVTEWQGHHFIRFIGDSVPGEAAPPEVDYAFPDYPKWMSPGVQPTWMNLRASSRWGSNLFDSDQPNGGTIVKKAEWPAHYCEKGAPDSVADMCDIQAATEGGAWTCSASHRCVKK